MFADKIFERDTIRGIADYLLFGLGPDEDDRSYEERLDEPYMRFEKAVEKYDKSKTSELLDLCNADDGYDKEYKWKKVEGVYLFRRREGCIEQE